MRFFTLMLIGATLAAGGCKKKNSAAPAPKPNEQAPAPQPVQVDDRNTAPVPGSSTLGGVRQAGRRTVALNDMSQLGTLIFAMELENNRMPSASDIKNSLKRDAPNILKQIDEGVIILTDTKNKGGLWAYEIDADKAGGIVLVAGTASRASADQVKQYLANK
jgi:hypothetical protein